MRRIINFGINGLLGLESKQDVREALSGWEWHQEKKWQRLPGSVITDGATAAMKNHSQYLILQRGSSSCKEVVNKDLETLTNKVENQKQRFLWKLSEWKLKTSTVGKRARPFPGGTSSRDHAYYPKSGLQGPSPWWVKSWCFKKGSPSLELWAYFWYFNEGGPWISC